MRKYYSICIFAFILILCCASTKMTSFVDPSYSDVTYKHLLIIYPSVDLDEKHTAENIYRDKFAKQGISIDIGIELLPPTREFSIDELDSIFSDHQIDGVLIVSFEDAWTKESYIPKSQSSSTKGSASVIGNSIFYKGKTKTTTYGGYTVSKPRVQFTTTLYDTKTYDIAWKASSTTKGNAKASYKTLINSLAETTITDLLKYQMLVPVETKEIK